MKILLIDDHALFRDGILLVLKGLNTEVHTIEANSYESAKLILNEQSDFDLVLLDFDLPGLSYLDALLAIKRLLPDSLIIILSGTDDHKMVEQAIRHGAQGYIPKSSPAKIMLNAVQLVISGGTYIPPEILKNKIITPSKHSQQPLLEDILTPRQCDVLHQLADGKSNKGIGVTLNLTESTVRVHVAAILKAFNVSNRTQAVQYAMKNSWIKS